LQFAICKGIVIIIPTFIYRKRRTPKLKSRKEKAKIAQWKLTEATSPQSRSPCHYPPVPKAPERQD
jgi:hypothetical protein